MGLQPRKVAGLRMHACAAAAHTSTSSSYRCASASPRAAVHILATSPGFVCDVSGVARGGRFDSTTAVPPAATGRAGCALLGKPCDTCSGGPTSAGTISVGQFGDRLPSTSSTPTRPRSRGVLDGDLIDHGLWAAEKKKHHITLLLLRGLCQVLRFAQRLPILHAIRANEACTTHSSPTRMQNRPRLLS